MVYGTVRISGDSHGRLRELARAEGTSMQALLDEAVEMLRRQRFLEQLNTAYADLRGDAKAWSEIEAQRGEWDSTLLDGLLVRASHASYKPPRPPGKARKRS
jgi:predicted transcriptional regulator